MVNNTQHKASDRRFGPYQASIVHAYLTVPEAPEIRHCSSENDSDAVYN